jgi:hypothetical protein
MVNIRNVGNNLRNNTASLPKRPETSSTPMWKPAASKYLNWLRICPPWEKIRKEALLRVMCFIWGPQPDYNQVITEWEIRSQMSCVRHLKDDRYVQNTSIVQKISLQSVQLSFRNWTMISIISRRIYCPSIIVCFECWSNIVEAPNVKKTGS